MAEGPTTINGVLHAPEASLDDREMTASFATPAAADAARQQLIAAGIAAERITLAGQATATPQQQADANPPDASIFGRIRQTVLPDDGNNALRAAAHDGDAVLTLRPLKAEVEMAVGILRAASPTHFDADLELWRNLG